MLFISFAVWNCKPVEIKNSDNLDQVERIYSSQTNLDEASIDIIVVPCSNGYEYSMANYDFNPIIEKELSKIKLFNVKEFPLKKLMGVNYQGVFDKKYCGPIIEKVEADYLVLTRFNKPYDEINREEIAWGYQVSIVNTKTLKQQNSISSAGLKEYNLIEKHIRENIALLKNDIVNLGGEQIILH